MSCSTTMRSCGSRTTAFQGTRLSGVFHRCPPASRGVAAAVMLKKGIHPEWHPAAPVICNGVEVMTVGGTKDKYNVDIYSGNHPFYQGVKSILVVDEGQLNKFKKRFADLEEFGAINTSGGKAEKLTIEKDPKKNVKGKKK